MSENTAAKTYTAENLSSPAAADELQNCAPGDSPAVESRRFSWRPSRGVQKHALFRITAHGAILQHVRTIRIQQRTEPTACELDPSAALEDVPPWVRDELQRDGHALVAGGVE
jgi:hypothetical protein